LSPSAKRTASSRNSSCQRRVTLGTAPGADVPLAPRQRGRQDAPPICPRLVAVCASRATTGQERAEAPQESSTCQRHSRPQSQLAKGSDLFENRESFGSCGSRPAKDAIPRSTPKPSRPASSLGHCAFQCLSLNRGKAPPARHAASQDNGKGKKHPRLLELAVDEAHAV
jgi:hypothetical protein